MKRYSQPKIALICLIAAIALLLIGLISYRNNLTTAYAKEQAILDADQANQDTTALLADLKAYSTQHMHADVSFMMTAAYDRAVTTQAASTAAAAQSSTATKDIYAAAQAACSGRADSITQSSCVVNYVNAHPATQATPVPVAAAPDKTQYSMAFASPLWSADLCGITLMLGGLSLLAAIGLFVQPRLR